jgi:16S rRNA (guanine966-N2)-methyltransferase
MRIIAGEWKGRRLKTVKGHETRPTADKVKGAMFNVLGEKVLGARVLDLFAGTGNLSWEALSRGASSAILVEKDVKALSVAFQNRTLLGAEDRAQIVKAEAWQFLKNYSQGRFDLIFLDPPYRQGIVEQTLVIIKELEILNLNGVLIAETASKEKIEGDLSPLQIRLTKEYGDTKVWFLQEDKE